MLLPDPHGHDYYTPFYLLATLTNVLLLLWEGWRRGFSLRPWLTLVAASSLALILGSKLITHPVGQWATVLFSNTPTDTARSILGGSLAAGLTVLALRRWQGLSWAVLDALALPLCAALVVQCVGCVLTGCCFGEPTAGAWGLTYAAGSPAWWAQVQSGLLPATAAQSLPVVPTQLLALLLCAAVAGVLLAVRRRQWPVGSWLLLQTGLLLLGRFAQGFWRDPASEPVAGDVHTVLGGEWLGLQLWLLPLALLALGVWRWRISRTPKPVVMQTATPAGGSGPRLLVVAFLLGLTAQLGHAALALPEILVVKALLLAMLVAETSAALATGRPGQPRLAGLPISLLLLGLIAVSTAQTPAPPDSANSATSRSLVVTGGTLGNYHEDDESIDRSSSGCGGQDHLALQQQVRAVGGEVGFETTKQPGPAGRPVVRSHTWGVGLWVGRQHIAAQPLPDLYSTSNTMANDANTTQTLADLHVYREGHRENGWRSIDARFGLHLGSLGYYSYFGSGETRNSTFLLPELMLRLGKPSVLYGQADFGYGAENALGAYTSRVALGSGLGFQQGPRLLVGYAHSPHTPSPAMGFASAVLRVPGSPTFSLEPYYATDFARHNSFSLKLNYRFARAGAKQP